MNSWVVIAVIAMIAAVAMAASSLSHREGLTALTATEAVNVVLQDGDEKVVYNTAANKNGARFAKLGAGVKCTRDDSVGDAVQFDDYRTAKRTLEALTAQLTSATQTYEGTQETIRTLQAQIRASGQ